MAPEAQPLDLSPAYLVQRHFQDSADVRLDGVGKSRFPTEIRWGLGVPPHPACFHVTIPPQARRQHVLGSPALQVVRPDGQGGAADDHR